MALLVFSPLLRVAADGYSAGDKLYVAPTSGVNLRANPSGKAPVLQQLHYNTMVTVLPDSVPENPYQVSVTNFDNGKLELKGHWVKVQAGNRTGYVFDGMLSPFKGQPMAPTHLSQEQDDAYYASLFGKPSTKTLQKTTVLQGKKFPYETVIKTYPKGMVEESTFFDGCYELNFTFKTTFNQAYWLIEQMLVDADAAQDIKIKKVQEGKVLLSFDSCT